MARGDMTRRSRMARRARATLLWGAAFFLAAQAALLFGFTIRTPSRDPEYDRRLASLKHRIAERAPGRPLVLFQGSSHIGLGIQPGVMAVHRPGAHGGPVVFNFGMVGSGPVAELLTLRRLLADGVHPDALVVEIMPYMVGSDMEKIMFLRPERYRWGDLGVVRRFEADGKDQCRQWLDLQYFPWFSYRAVLLDQWAPRWAHNSHIAGHVRDVYCGLDAWGWNADPVVNPPADPQELYHRIDSCKSINVPLINRFEPQPKRRKALEELAETCRREKIDLAFLLFPDPFIHDYTPEGRLRVDDFVRGVSRDCGAPVIDARTWWAGEDDFGDGGHVSYAAGARLSRRLEREVLQPYLGADRSARRWPVGELKTPPLAYCGPGFTIEALGYGFVDRLRGTLRRWAGAAGGDLVLFNPSDRPRTVALRFTAYKRAPGNARLVLQGSLLSDRLEINQDGVPFERVVRLPPGKQVLRMTSDAPDEAHPPFGFAAFGLSNCTLSEVEVASTSP